MLRRLASSRYVVAAAVLLFSSFAMAQQPADTSVEYGKEFSLPLVGGVKCTAMFIQGKDSPLLVVVKPEGMRLFSVTPFGQPSPKPGPEPNPEPQPKPQPTPGALSVLVLYDSDLIDNGPVQQASIATSKEVRDYLTAKCAKEKVKMPDGKEIDKPAFRFLSKKSADDIAKLPAAVQTWVKDAMTRKLPTIIISNGKDIYRGDLPANVADTMKLLRAYGG